MRIMLLFLSGIFIPLASIGAVTLTTLAEEVIIYSGPGENYRPLAIVKAKTDMQASAKPFIGRDGSPFYKVIHVSADGRKSLGYILTSAAVRIKTEEMTEEDVEKYSDLALSKRTAQTTFSYLRGDNQHVTIGLNHYLTPGFFWKGFAGFWRSPSGNAGTLGIEGGNDALIFKNVSTFVTLGFGAFVPGAEGRVFEASKILNAMAIGSIGVRYNRPTFAVGVGFTESVLFNGNNSLAVFGALLSADWAW